MRRPYFFLVACLGLAFCAAGCDRSADGDDDSAQKPKKKDAVKIDPIAGKLGAFDEGRIEVPLPKGWRESTNEEPADNDPNANLGRMASGSQRLPGILVKVREYPDFKTLGPSDLRKFVRRRTDEVTDERNSKKKFNVKQLSLRSFNGAEYAYTVRVSGRPYERLAVETVVDGRLYTLELFTVNGLREESRPALYAVATGLKFPKMINKPSRGRASADEEAEAETDEDSADKAEKDDAASDEEKPDEKADE